MMKRQPILYNELLNAEELAFLERKELRERKQFYKVVRMLILLSFICPFVLAWYKAIDGVPNPFGYGVYFLGVLFLLGFSGFALWIVYRSNLGKVRADIAGGSKIVEQVRITRKQHMAVNNSFYFYLDSLVKLSIEVSEKDFHQLSEGDEVNIEYTANAKLYLGYF